MNGWRGLLGGALALIALQALVQPTASDRVGGLVGWSTGLVRKFMDPTVPAIPDHSKPHEPFDPFNAFASTLGNAIKGIVTGPVDAIGGAAGAVGGALGQLPGVSQVGGFTVGSAADLARQLQQRK